MTKHSKLPPYITRDKGPDGKERFYYRRPGQKKVRIFGVPYTPGFMAAYGQAMGGANVVAITPPPPKHEGSLRWLCEQYLASGEFQQLDEKETQPRRRNNLATACKEGITKGNKRTFGDMPYKLFKSNDIRNIRDRFAESPNRANSILKTLKALFVWAGPEVAKLVDEDYAADVKLLRVADTGGHHTWTIEELEQYESKWEVGTRERLALTLLLYSGQRASDIIQFGPGTVVLRDDCDEEGNPVKRKWLAFTQHKNRNRNRVVLEIPLRPELEAIIEATDVGDDAWLLADNGKPFANTKRFCEWFEEPCKMAEVPGRSHGLRKACAVRLIENGATEKEVAAITGHQTLQEIVRYTKAASQKKLAASATARTKVKTNG